VIGALSVYFFLWCLVVVGVEQVFFVVLGDVGVEQVFFVVLGDCGR
jgi:hypothetical protein